MKSENSHARASVSTGREKRTFPTREFPKAIKEGMPLTIEQGSIPVTKKTTNFLHQDINIEGHGFFQMMRQTSVWQTWLKWVFNGCSCEGHFNAQHYASLWAAGHSPIFSC